MNFRKYDLVTIPRIPIVDRQFPQKSFPINISAIIENFQPLIDNIHIPIKDLLTSKDIFQTAISMAVNKNSIHSVKKFSFN